MLLRQGILIMQGKKQKGQTKLLWWHYCRFGVMKFLGLDVEECDVCCCREKVRSTSVDLSRISGRGRDRQVKEMFS